MSEAKFRAAIRAGVALAGVLVTQIPGIAPWVGLAIIAAANLIAAGQRNPPAEPGN